MEEVDAIILHSLREIGCNLEEDARLRTLTPEEIFKCLGKLCKSIKPDAEISNNLPVQMAQRFAAASQIVDCCKSLGFNGDLGYQTILYSNPNELRRILMWLIEHIPKSEDKTDSFHGTKDISRAKSIEGEILRKLKNDLRRPWVLEFLQPPSNAPSNPVHLEKPNIAENMDKETLEYKRKFEAAIFHQTRSLMTSIIATHDTDLVKDKSSGVMDASTIAQKLRHSAIRSTQSLNVMSSPTKSVISVSQPTGGGEELEKPKLKTRVEILTEKIEDLKDKIEDQEDIYRQLTIDKRQQLKSIGDENVRLEELKKDLKLKMQIGMLLDDPEESKQKLEQSLEAAVKKRENLNNKYEAHKKPLEEHLESFSGTNSLKIQKAEEKVASIKSAKQKIEEIREDLKTKTQAQQQLQAEMSQMKRITERSAYTSRIVDIIKSIKKQNFDINDILKDTKALQKAINTIEGQLQRQFNVTEDLIWNKTNKTDAYSKRAYKLLITLHTEFSELINLIETTGSIQREIRELEDQIDNERQQNVRQKLEQITRDLEMIVDN